MTLKINKFFKLLMSTVILLSLSFLLVGCKKKKFYKYNGEIYDDSYNYKNDYGYKYLEQNNEKAAKKYEELYLMMVDFSHKDDDVDKKAYKDLFFKYNLKEDSFTYGELYMAYGYLTCNNPQFFWLDYDINMITGDCCVGIGEQFIKGEDRKKFAELLNSEITKIDKLMEGKEDEFIKINTLSNYIMDNMTYAFNENGQPENAQWAHSIVGFFERNYGVCESYAKVFKLLCDRYEIGNIPVMSDDHIWNLVEYKNEWYVYDLTFDDDKRNSYVGMTEDVYADPTHEYIEFLYPLPENKAKTPLSLGEIALKEDGETIYTSHSMNDIMNHFNNGNYEIVLSANDNKANAVYYIDSISDKYTSLTISSNQTEDNQVLLYLTRDISLTKDLTCKNINLKVDKKKTITLNDNTLRLENTYLSLLISIDGANVIITD